MHGGITSASREAIRQTFRRANTLYFYNTLYEGGVCDRNCFVTGTTPAQTVEPIVEHRDEEVGQEGLRARGRLQLRPDHRASGCSTTSSRAAARSLQTDFFPLDVTDFGPTIAKIQAAKPDFVCVGAGRRRAHLVLPPVGGGGHEQEDPAGSTTFGVGNEHLALSPAEGDGILIAGNYSQEDRRRRPTRTSSRAGPSASATPRSCTRSRSRSTRASSCGPRRSRRPARSTATKVIEGARVRHQHRRPGRHGHDRPGDAPCRRSTSSVMEVKDQKLTIKQAFKQRRRATPPRLRPDQEPERQQAVRGRDLRARSAVDTCDAERVERGLRRRRLRSRSST